MLHTSLELLVSALLVLGALFVFLAAVGMARLPDLYSRLHAPGIGTTLGLCAVLAASMLHLAGGGTTSLRELLIAFFVFITAPVSTHLLARASLHLRVAHRSDTGAGGGPGAGQGEGDEGGEAAPGA